VGPVSGIKSRERRRPGFWLAVLGSNTIASRRLRVLLEFVILQQSADCSEEYRWKEVLQTSHRKLSISFYSAEFETDLRSIDAGFGSVLLSRLLLQTRFTVKVLRRRRRRRRRRTWIFCPVFSWSFFCSDIAQKFGFKKFPKFWLLCV